MSGERELAESRVAVWELEPGSGRLAALGYEWEILDAVADAITMLAPKRGLVYANQAAARLMGYDSAGALLAATREQYLQPFEIRDEQGDPIPLETLPGQRALRGEHTETLIRYWRKSDREERWSRCKARPLLDVDGNVRLAIVVISDVTAEKRAERDSRFLSEAGTRLAAPLDFTATMTELAHVCVPEIADLCAAFVAEGKGGRFVQGKANDPELEAFLRVLESQYPADVTGSTPMARVAQSGHSQVFRGDDLQHAIDAEAEPFRTLLRGMGEFECLLVPLVARGRTLGTMNLLLRAPRRFDPHMIELAEELARRAALVIDNARLYSDSQSALVMRDDFLAAASHDLKSPLGAIAFSASVVRRAAEDSARADLARYAESILRATDSMERLIHGLLDLAALQAGQLSMRREPNDAQALACEALDVLEPLAAEKGVALACEVPAVGVVCDRDRVLQVLSNLAGNAIKFTPAGGTVRVTAEPRGGRLVVSVADSGPGIDPDLLPRLFDRRYMAARRGQPGQGTGLGLSIVKALVEAHGGEVTVESQPGRGTCFRFDLPLA